MNIKEQIEYDLRATFKKMGFDESTAIVSVSAIDICDYQCNACFALGKSQKKSPLEIAKQIAATFRSKTATCEAVPPAFLNFRVTDVALVSQAKQILETNHLPFATQPKRTIFFDYGGANIAKELHVGHLRSPIVGEALKRVFQALGHKTLSDVYLGDWGLQNGLILAELESQKYINDNKFSKTISLDLLNTVYPLASKKKDTDQKFKDRAAEITLLVQQKKQPWFGLWQQLRDTSVTKIRENYNKLNCTFDFYKGESDAQPHVETVIDILKKKKLAYDNDNCLIMDVIREGETAPMPPIILKKYNGGDLYATNDVTTLYYRTKDFNPDEFIYITDARQSLHFEQVFRCVKLGGFVPNATRLTHIGFGTMNGADGKPFKTRAGGTIKFEEVIDLVTQAAAKRIQGEDKSNAPKIGLAALKFSDLSNNVKKDYVFDIDKFTSFEGKTGPYILYTIARINSIFTKNGEQSNNTIHVTDVTRDILIKVLKLADSYAVAAANYTMNGIADAAWALAAAFNVFYANTNILREQDKDIKNKNLSVCELVRVALKQAMHTLAIDIVNEM